MNLDWQTAVTLALVASACAYLARLAWLAVARRKAAACGGCGTCPANVDDGEPQVVALGAISQPAAAASNGAAQHTRESP